MDQKLFSLRTWAPGFAQNDRPATQNSELTTQNSVSAVEHCGTTEEKRTIFVVKPLTILLMARILIIE